MRSAVSAAVRKADAVRQGCGGGLAVGVEHGHDSGEGEPPLGS
jgi:hypothetical protein